MTSSHSDYGPTWYAETMAPRRERPALAHNIDVDVCIIGGGLAGLTTAREIARRGWSVAVLEARRIAWSASGRNGGFVLPGFGERPQRIVERVGLDRAKELWALSQAGVGYVRKAIRDGGMPGVEPVDGYLSVQRTNNPAELSATADLLGGEFGTEVEFWPVEQVRAALRSRQYFQALHFPGAFHIHPLNYALGLAAAAEQAGAQIYEQTPALAIDPAGVRKRIDVPGARVRAGHIVLAGSAHLAPLFPMVSRSILPIATYLAVTAPLGDRLADAITYQGGVADTRRVFEYYRIVSGDRLMWGGHVSSRLSPPRGLARLLRRDIGKTYPQLGGAEITHAWTGIMGFAVHKMPQIGEIWPGLWVASAFGGQGLNTTAMAGDLIARAIIEGDDRWRLFASYDLVWAGGILGRAVAQVAYWSMQLRDMLEETLARRRAAASAVAERSDRAEQVEPGDAGPTQPTGQEADSFADVEQQPAERTNLVTQPIDQNVADQPQAPARAKRKDGTRFKTGKGTDGVVFATRDPAQDARKVKRRKGKRAAEAAITTVGKIKRKRTRSDMPNPE